MRSYTELSKIDTFIERYNYLRLDGQVGYETFGFDRYLNQMLYKSKKWQRVRDEVIIRDNGSDLGMEGYEIYDKIIVHHMNPITIEDIESDSDDIYNPEYLICTRHYTHLAIHYGDENLLPQKIVQRKSNDMAPWKKEV